MPVGGMGAVSGAIARAATDGRRRDPHLGRGQRRSAPATTAPRWTSTTAPRRTPSRPGSCSPTSHPGCCASCSAEPEDPETKPQGCQLKINFLLDRLPRLRSGVDPAVAFAGTLHVGEDYSQLEKAYAEAAAGQVPTTMPGEVYCHSLTDPSILGEAPEGMHTLTYFGVHTPAALFEGPGRAEAKQLAVSRALAAINEQLAEPIESCLARDADGNPCLEAKIPQEVEADLAMPGGHIYHGDLEWPWANNRARLDTPAQQWGVQTDHDSVLVCGAGARRGGAVSGIGGHNAAHAVLAAR